MLNLNASAGTEFVSVITNPFLKDSIKYIGLFMGYGRPATWSGYIEFVKGSTEGKQNIVDTKDFNDAVNQLKSIIESLKSS